MMSAVPTQKLLTVQQSARLARDARVLRSLGHLGLTVLDLVHRPLEGEEVSSEYHVRASDSGQLFRALYELEKAVPGVAVCSLRRVVREEAVARRPGALS